MAYFSGRRRPSTQDWSVGSTVKVGFLSLIVTGKYDGGYRLVGSKGQTYEFEPYRGLFRVY